VHEVSLMKNLLGVVEKTIEKEGGGKVEKIHILIGAMSGVNTDALDFAFEVLSKGTSAEGGVIEYESIPLALKCRECGLISNPKDFIFSCSHCDSRDIEIVGGREMEIDYILMDDE